MIQFLEKFASLSLEKMSYHLSLSSTITLKKENGSNLNGYLTLNGFETGNIGTLMNVKKKCLTSSSVLMSKREVNSRLEEDWMPGLYRNLSFLMILPAETIEEMVIAAKSQLNQFMMTEKYFTLNLWTYFMKIQKLLTFKMDFCQIMSLFMSSLTKTSSMISTTLDKIPSDMLSPHETELLRSIRSLLRHGMKLKLLKNFLIQVVFQVYLNLPGMRVLLEPPDILSMIKALVEPMVI